ncbi:MAG: hypothetical protein CBARDMAM_6125 [uncultured Caballeronia sp.]|nr:MAG: hypothetical protein CBARDMAM_6125 [uncultured Caballeronia sp.]
MVLAGAQSTLPVQLDGGVFGLEGMAVCPSAKALRQLGGAELVHPAALVADGKSPGAPNTVARLARTGNPGVEGREPMDQAVIAQLFQCAIDLRRCAKSGCT